jgi:hypothetical protein
MTVRIPECGSGTRRGDKAPPVKHAFIVHRTYTKSSAVTEHSKRVSYNPWARHEP